MHVKLYEDIARHGQIATAYAYPVKVEGRYVMDPSPIPKFDNPKLSDNPAIQLFGAGREQRIYALPPYTQVVSLDFDDHPFVASKAAHDCDLCGAARQLSGRGDHRRSGRADVCLFGHRFLPRAAARPGISGGLARRSDGGRMMERDRSAVKTDTRRCFRSRPDQTLWHPHRLRRCVASICTPARCWGSSAKAGRANRPCCPALPGIWRRTRVGGLRHRLWPARYADDGRSRTPHAGAHRLGLCAPEPARRVADGGLGGWQRGRTADGDWRAPLWRYPRTRRWIGWAGWRLPPTASMTVPRPFPAACSNGCRSPAIW